MKRTFLMAFMLILSASMFVSCGSDDGGSPESNNGGGNAITGGGGGAPYTGNDKEFLDQTGQQLIASFGKNDFDNFKAIRLVLEDERYKTDDIEDRFDIDHLKELVDGTNASSTRYYRTLLQASKFNGEYTVVNNRWQYSSNPSLCKFVFADANGQQVIATVTTSGAEKNVYVVQDRKSHYTYNGTNYNYTYDYNDIGIAIPERIDVNITQGGRTIITCNATFNLSNITENARYDLSRNNIDVTTKVVINEKYAVNVSKASYVANGQSSASFTVSNGNTTIISGTASANSRITNSSYDDIEVHSLTGINASVDILGRVQIKAQCNDGKELGNLMEEADDKKYDETAFKNKISQINSKFSANAYYNNDGTVRATITLGAFGKQYYNYQSQPTTRWESKPIITFMSDNSSYAFDEYFTDSQFPTVWENFKDLVRTVAANFTDDKIDF